VCWLRRPRHVMASYTVKISVYPRIFCGEVFAFNSFCSDVALYCSYAAVICLAFYVLFLILFYLCAIAIRSYDRKFQINTYLVTD